MFSIHSDTVMTDHSFLKFHRDSLGLFLPHIFHSELLTIGRKVERVEVSSM